MNYLSIIPRPTGVNVDTPLSFAIYAPIHYNFKLLKPRVDGVTNREKEKEREKIKTHTHTRTRILNFEHEGERSTDNKQENFSFLTVGESSMESAIIGQIVARNDMHRLFNFEEARSKRRRVEPINLGPARHPAKLVSPPNSVADCLSA